MLIDISLGVLFVGSSFALWYRLSQKIPEAVAIHDEVITRRLHENSARLRIFLLHFKTFYKEEYYHSLFWNFLGKLFFKLHILVLRIDNYVMRILKKIRTRKGFSGLCISEQEMQERVIREKTNKTPSEYQKKAEGYWRALKSDTAMRARAPRKRPIEGVRVHTQKTSVKSEMIAE